MLELLPCVPGTMALSVASTSTFLKGGALRRASPTPAHARRLPNRCGALGQLCDKVVRHEGAFEWRQGWISGRTLLHTIRSDA